MDILTTVTEFSADLQGAGTTESVWLASPGLSAVRRWVPALPTSGRVVVVAPHPDDEILGAGGTISKLVCLGARHVAVAVTDGESSHPESAAELRRLRPLESRAAAEALDILPVKTHRLEMRDGDVQARPLAAMLVDLLEPGDLVLAPWVKDGHPDHTQVALGVDMACRMKGADELSYLVWAWHWARPDQLPWHKALRIEFDDRLTVRKRQAVQCFRTQLEGRNPILPPEAVRRLTRHFEVLMQP